MTVTVGGTPLLLSMDGADGSTSFTDSSPSPKAVTAVGDAKLSTAQSKFGGSSAYFDGVGDSLDIAGPLGWNPTEEDYTVEAWVYLESLANDPYVFSAGDASTNALALHWVSGNARWEALSYGSGGDYLVSSVASTTNVWEHWLISRVGGMVRMFKDGVLVASYTNVPAPMFSASAGATIGYKRFSGAAGNYFKGYVDDVRILKSALHTSDFTPPTTARVAIPATEIQFAGSGQKRTAGLGTPFPTNTPVFGSRPQEGIDRLPLGIPQNNYEWSLNPAANVMQFKGRGKIVGTVKTKNSPTNLPAHRRVRLYREPDGLLIRTVWSDPVTGVYEFIGIPMDTTYTVVSHDYTGAFRAVLADGLTPDPAT